MIVSYIPGRVRLRNDALKSQENIDTLLGLAGTVDGITSITPNLKTGSVLVTYDTAQIDEESLQGIASMMQAMFGESEVPSSPIKKCAKILDRKKELAMLTATFGLTVGSLFFGRRLHAIAGVAFTALSIKHMVDRKKSF